MRGYVDRLEHRVVVWRGRGWMLMAACMWAAGRGWLWLATPALAAACLCWGAALWSLTRWMAETHQGTDR